MPYRLSVLTNRVSNAIARHYSERFSLSIPEWRVIAVLGQTPGLSAREVAERTAMDKVQVSRAVQSLLMHYREHNDSALDSYSERALQRAWNAVRFSWWMTTLTHVMGDEFSGRLQRAEFEILKISRAAAELLAQNYCGLVC